MALQEDHNQRHAGRHRSAFGHIGSVTLFALVGAVASGGCIDPGSPLIKKNAEGCDEFQAGTDVPTSLAVNPKVRSFMQAASDFVRNADDIKSSVVAACTSIAMDLGATDTWSALKDTDQAISNDNGTGACDAAGSRIEQALVDAGKVNAHVALAVSRGECHLDFAEQAACDASCAAHEQCDAGTVQTRCEPGALSVVCDGMCTAGAHCDGKVDTPCNCMGQCESECVGQCHGDCIGEDGQRTTDNPNCVGKCTSSCNGTCKGMCKIEKPEGISCGASVRCTGGCTGTVGDPVCVSEFTPPHCVVDEDCHAACSAKVAEDAVCDPPVIRIFADINATPDIKAVVDTLQANLPPLFQAANDKGKLVLDAAGRLGDTGKSLGSRITDLDGKSLACLGQASTAVGDTIGSIDVAVSASVHVTVTTTNHTE
jgi:hypothetical protein